MIKIIKTVVVLFLSFFVVGCGSTTSTKPSIGTESLNIQVEKTNIQKDNKLDIDFLVKNGYGKGIKVILSDFNLNTDGCSIKNIKFTPNTLSLDNKINKKILKAEVLFQNSCIPKSYSIDAKTILSLDGQSNEISFSSPKNDLNLTNVSGINDTNNSSSDINDTILPKYTFVNIPKYIKIDKANKEYNFKIQLVDLDKKIVSGQNVYISSYDTTFGELKSYSSSTDSNGFAHFSFTSSTSITDLIGKTLKFTLHNDTGFSKIDADIELNFDKSSNGLHNGYNLSNETNLIVEYPKKDYSITIDLFDTNGIGIADKIIKITTPDNRFGFIENSTAKTNSAGRARFKFISSNNIEDINGKSTKVRLEFSENGLNISKEITITILKKSKIDYQLINTTDLLVEFPNKKYLINAYLVDNRGVAVSGKDIEITTPDSRFGTIDNASKKTSSTGKVSFTYTSPNDIKSIDGESTTVRVLFTEDGVQLSKTIKIEFMIGVVDTTLPTVVIPNDLREIVLSNNSQTVDIPIKVFKDIVPYNKGFVNIQLPSKVLDGVDVGSFDSFSIPVDDNGIATLHYTAPSNLKALMDKGDLNSTFKIYHSENSSKENRKSLVMKYKISDENNYISVNYNMDIVTDNNFSMGIPNIEKSFTVILKDSKGNIINDKDINITSIKVTTQNSLIAQLLDINSSSLVDSLDLNKINNSSFILKSKTLSGLVPIKVVINFKDINGDEKEISKIVNVRVMSGLPSAISISYLSSGQDKSRAKYIDKFVVSVTDEYGNRVNTQPNISLGAVVGYAVDGREADGKESANTKRLFYGKIDIDSGVANGIIDDLGDNDVHKTTFRDDTPARSDVFQYVNREGNNSDKLILFGRGKSYNAMGKWDFNKDSDSILNLEDNYLGEIKDGLYYAVGHNYYQDQCLDDGREWLGTTDAESYQLDSEGSAVISYKYDYKLMGKDAMIWVNLNGYQPDIEKNVRIGEAIKHTLRGQGIISKPSGGYSLDKNETTTVTFDIWHKDSVEAYRNAKFGYRVVEGSNCMVIGFQSSNSYDARTCSNGFSKEGRAYITFSLKAPEDKSCTFNIDNLLVAHEF